MKANEMNVTSIERWHQKARLNPPEKDFNVQLGCHFEEGVEMLEALTGESRDSLAILDVVLYAMRYLAQGLAEVLPAGEVQAWVEHCKPAQDVYGAIQDAHMAAEDARQFARTAHEKGRGVHEKAIETYVAEQTRMTAEQLPAWRAALEPLLQD